MAVQNLEITPENILSVVVKLPENEFKSLFSNAQKLRQKKSENQADKEVRLVKQVNESILSDAERLRFDELVQKRRDENIGENEQKELTKLADKSEELNTKRLEYLVEIAEIRDKSLREVMKELEISSPQTI
jgi:hypothetical protein